MKWWHTLNLRYKKSKSEKRTREATRCTKIVTQRAPFFMTLIVCYGSIDITRLYLKAKKSQKLTDRGFNYSSIVEVTFFKTFRFILKDEWVYISPFYHSAIRNAMFKATNMSDKEKSLFAYKLVEKPWVTFSVMHNGPLPPDRLSRCFNQVCCLI